MSRKENINFNAFQKDKEPNDATRVEPSSPSATREQVASKPTPTTFETSIFDFSNAFLEAMQMLDQMFSEDCTFQRNRLHRCLNILSRNQTATCSNNSGMPGGWNMVIGSDDVPSSFPSSEKTPHLAEPVPTSMPMA
jgi:hypothetical protein